MSKLKIIEDAQLVEYLISCFQRHRVVWPEQAAASASHSRQSIVCFVHPDADCVIESVINKPEARYPPITAQDYLQERFSQTFIS